jgi:uncharacterized protein (DUF4415 family)
MTEAEIYANALADPDNPPTTSADWKNAKLVMPKKKIPMSVRLDRDVLFWFRSFGKGYQTRINAVLRAYMMAHRR